MKKLLIPIMAIIILCTGCESIQNALPKPDSTAISVIGDKTDPLKKQPDEKEILALYNLNDDHLYDGFTLRYKDVEDVSLTDVKTLKVNAVSPILASSNDRVSELKSFKDGIKQTFENAKKNYHGNQNRSLVYSSVISEANYLMSTNSKNKYLIVYSNMLDNCESLNFYNPVFTDMVARHPEQAMESLERMTPISNLKGLKVIICYQSNDHDYAEEKLFRVADGFYSKLLTKHGAEVVTVQNIDMLTQN